MTENGIVTQHADRMWFTLKVFLLGFSVVIIAVLGVWCLRKSYTVNNFTIKEDVMMYIVVAVTAVSTRLVTVLFNSLYFVQPNTRNCTENGSSTFRRVHLTRQVPSVCSDQHFYR